MNKIKKILWIGMYRFYKLKKIIKWCFIDMYRFLILSRWVIGNLLK